VSNILIVEDNPYFRETLRVILHSRFPDVHIAEAESGESALEKLGFQRQDIILLDIRLPGMNGIEVARKVKEHHGECKIIVLTESDTAEYRDAAFNVGADAFLSKHQKSLTEILDQVAIYLQE
jgi:DNA-binding NarL/FixJ family response regulator